LNHIRTNLFSYLLYFCFPLTLAACWAAARWTTGRHHVVLTSLAAIAILLVGGKQVVFVIIGGYMFGNLLLDAWKNQDWAGLFLGL
jgi:hypothetical protein